MDILYKWSASGTYGLQRLWQLRMGTGMCRKLYKSLGKYVVSSIDNKHNYIPAQCNAKQAVINNEMKGDHD
jgi:hypothetical protein